MVEKRSLMAKKVIEQVARKKVTEEMGESAYLALRRRKKMQAAGKTVVNLSDASKTYFTSGRASEGASE